VAYIASVGVGSPPTNYDLIIDTGSANFWVGSIKPYVETSTSHQTPDSVAVSYGSGNFSGSEFIDKVTISSDLVIPKQSIGVAKTSNGFDTVNGIIGVGPSDLNIGTLSPDTKSAIPTVTDNLYADGTIAEAILAISFEPITNSNGTQINGELTWGGVDYTKFIGEITFTPITSTNRSSMFWGIDACMSYGDTSILATTAGIVDTGTTTVQLATDTFNKYQVATGGVPDSTTGLLKLTPAQYASLKSIFVNVNGVAFEWTPNAQIWPRNLNSVIGGTAGSFYLVVLDLGTPSGSGLDFILGQAFLERFYSVYDTGNHRVGLAKTKYTDATTN